MTDTPLDGQAALRLLARAHRALVEEGTLSTAGLLPAWRALAPSFHAGAAADVVDVALIARMRSLGGDALLAADTIAVTSSSPRAPMRFVNGALAAAKESVTGDALAIALALSLEAAKLAHGLVAPADALRAAFATPADAQRALDALRAGGDARDVDATRFFSTTRVDDRRVDVPKLRALAANRAVYVVAGPGGRRVHDLLSPFARRLRMELAQVGALQSGGPLHKTARGDEVYAGIEALYDADDGGVDEERALIEAKEGFDAAGPGVVAVRCDALADSEVDPRLREAAAGLKRGRALLVVVEERASSLRNVLDAVGRDARAVVCVVDGTHDGAPTLVSEPAASHVAAIANALADGDAHALTLPSLAFASAHASDDGALDDALFPLAQAILQARAAGALSGEAKLALKTVPAGDVTRLSQCCIDLLARLGPSKAASPARARPLRR